MGKTISLKANVITELTNYNHGFMNYRSKAYSTGGKRYGFDIIEKYLKLYWTIKNMNKPFQKIQILPIDKSDYLDLSLMVGELLNEIMTKINHKTFNYNQTDTTKRIEEFISLGKYWVFIAKDMKSGENIGFVSLYESFALYAEGAYGTMPELYVRPNWRSKHIGNELLKQVSEFAKSKNWQRIEVTTPPLPEFDRTLEFYQRNGFKIAGGRKLKIDI